MDKDKIKNKIEDLEAELQELKQLANEPEQRKPEAGDVWRDVTVGIDYLLLEGGYKKVGGTDVIKMTIDHSPWTSGEYTYLGKFDEVYVKISDVREAFNLRVTPVACYASPNYNKLEALNIIQD
jgi:hypothetical protein